jgi:O-6-methylguanine DNA methyltransferase
VWEAIRQIPFGQTVTYQELAARIGSPGAARAVGGACAANRLLLAVPCHRVVACRGLGGFALGLAWKRKLLALEAAEAAAFSGPGKTTPGKPGKPSPY